MYLSFKKRIKSIKNYLFDGEDLIERFMYWFGDFCLKHISIEDSYTNQNPNSDLSKWENTANPFLNSDIGKISYELQQKDRIDKNLSSKV